MQFNLFSLFTTNRTFSMSTQKYKIYVYARLFRDRLQTAYHTFLSLHVNTPQLNNGDSTI
jgi:uncharacterized protein YigE (DUF2233 family)